MKRFLLLALLFVLAVPERATSQNIYIKFDGIDGESNNASYSTWSDVLSYSHSMFNQVVLGGSAGVPQHAPVSFVKEIDSSTPPLIAALNNGTRIDDAVFEFTRIVGGAPAVYVKVELTGVYVSSYSQSASPGFLISENFSILYEKIVFTYWPVQGSGLGSPIVTTWDVLNETPLPAAVVSLDVRSDGNDVIFEWRTLSESGNYGFEVQHQEQGEFRRAAYIPATGWSSQSLSYQVRVRGLEEGIHTFRVASLSLGGAVTYSREITVALGVPDGLTLALDAPYPNPFTDRTNIAVSTARDDVARISVWDVLGREIAVIHEGPLQSGIKSRFVFDPEQSLAAGTYIVRVKTERDVTSRMVSVVR